jgi:hypothetical protein
MNGFVTLDYIVSSYILKAQEDDRYYETYLQYAIQGLEQLRLGAMSHVKVAHLTLDENNTAPLPSDFIDYTVIGVCDGGRIRELSENPNICLPTELECGLYQRNVTTTDENENLHKQSWSYTAEGGFNTAYFRVDKAGWRIVFLNDASANGTPIIMEYIANDITKDSIIPRDAVPVLEAYINYVKVEYNSNVNIGEKRMAQRNYRNKRRQYRAGTYSFTAKRFLDVVSQNYTQGIKR